MADTPDSRIVKFIKKHHVLTLATNRDNKPWCCNCFYAYMPGENIFVFTSDMHTRHVEEIKLNSHVAASVVLETKIIGKIQGIQIEGTILNPDKELYAKANTAYIKRFPFAILADTHLWLLDPSHIKMTDNTLGFGKKLVWKKGKIIT